MGADHHVVLPDHRVLGYADWGDPDGHPVLYFHGGLSCRLDIAFADRSAAGAGVRLLALDRPGIGRSDRLRGRSVAACVADVAALVDALDIARFAALGWSAGGPYALACAALLGDRITRAATVGGAAPLHGRRDVKELGLRGDRVLIPLAQRAPTVAAAAVRLTGSLPDRLLRRTLLADLRSSSDRSVVRDLDWAFVSEAVRRGGWGTVDDYRALTGRWGFDPSAITVPVTLWQGGDDDLLPIAHARRLAHRVPNARFEVVPGAGHFLLHGHLDRVLADLQT